MSKAGGTTTHYLYSADKTKLASRNTAGYGYDYLGSLVYKTDGGGCKLESAAFEGGRIKTFNLPGFRKFYLSFYDFKDHLGSVRVTISHTGVVQGRNNYYPFGKRWNNDGSAAYDRWQFNGKEKQPDFDFLDYGARMYDPGLGRWTTGDPHLESYLNHSQYAYCINNPVNMIDPTGEDVYFLRSDGRMILGLKTDDDTDQIYGLTNGHVDYMNSVDVNKGFMGSYRMGFEEVYNRAGTGFNMAQVSYYQFENFTEAKRVFEFLADNSEVEWGMVSDSETNHIYTSHDAKTLNGNVKILFGNNPFIHMHSHKKSPNPSDPDRGAAGLKKLSNLKFNIYYNKQYYIYDGQTKFSSLSFSSFY